MNERIKELAEQADIKFDVYSDNYGVDTATVVPYDLEKFAELIIRECMSVARGMRNPPNLNYKPSDRFVDELRLHFGVKE
jgi:hypothetical protein